MALPSQAPKTEQVITLLTPEDKSALSRLAAANRLTLSEHVRNVLLAHLRAEGAYILSHVKQLEGQLGLFEEEK